MEENTHQKSAQKSASILFQDDVGRHLTQLQYPLRLSFKIFAFTNQAIITDASGKILVYTKQKLFRIREHVEVFTDTTMATRLADIHANKVIDWSVRYNISDSKGNAIGSVGRKGWKSIWKAHYEVFNPGDNLPDFTIQEENPFAKIMDGFLAGIPILGFFSGYFFHPRYLATNRENRPTMRLEKKAAFFEGHFEISKLGELTLREELNLILSFMMMTMVERQKG